MRTMNEIVRFFGETELRNSRNNALLNIKRTGYDKFIKGNLTGSEAEEYSVLAIWQGVERYILDRV